MILRKAGYRFRASAGSAVLRWRFLTGHVENSARSVEGRSHLSGCFEQDVTDGLRPVAFLPKRDRCPHKCMDLYSQ